MLSYVVAYIIIFKKFHIWVVSPVDMWSLSETMTFLTILHTHVNVLSHVKQITIIMRYTMLIEDDETDYTRLWQPFMKALLVVIRNTPGWKKFSGGAWREAKYYVISSYVAMETCTIGNSFKERKKLYNQCKYLPK